MLQPQIESIYCNTRQKLYAYVVFNSYKICMIPILDGRPYAITLKQELLVKTKEVFGDRQVYMAIIFVWDNAASAAYVWFKKQFGEDIGMAVEIFGQNAETKFDHLKERKTKFVASGQRLESQSIIALIQFLNTDSQCVGIIVQLPLPDPLWTDTARITQHISPYKDVDAMSGMTYGMDSFGTIDFLGATPQAAMTLLEQYDLADVRGKIVSVVWQSNLIGKPLATHLMKMGATVLSFNSKSPKEQMYTLCQQSDYIFACTGVTHVINEKYINDKKHQIVIDIGYGYRDWKPIGDVNIDAIKDKVYAYSPVPGWVWPLTVASLFANIFRLHTYFSSQQ